MDEIDRSPPIPPKELVAHAGFVRSLARSIVHGDEAEDVAQETLARGLEAGPRDPHARRSWLATVVRRVAMTFRRTDVRRASREARAGRPEPAASAVEEAARAETLRRVVECVEMLPPPERTVVVLRHYEALPPRDIAARLGIPVATVKGRL